MRSGRPSVRVAALARRLGDDATFFILCGATESGERRVGNEIHGRGGDVGLVCRAGEVWIGWTCLPRSAGLIDDLLWLWRR